MLNDNYTPKKFNRIGSNGKILVEWCVDFLIYKTDVDGNKIDTLSLKSNAKELRELNKKSVGFKHLNKYITIWSFIYDFLKINKDSGYDYWLMNMLEWYDIMEHGSGIRCGWFNSDKKNIYKDRILTQERIEKIEKWIVNTPDDI